MSIKSFADVPYDEAPAQRGQQVVVEMQARGRGGDGARGTHHER